MPIVCQVLSSYRCCLSMFINMCTDVHSESTLFRAEVSAEPLQGSIGDFGLQDRPKQAVALGVQCSSWWLSTPVKKFPRILEKSRCREFECFHISYKLNMFWICFESFVFLFAKKRPPGRANIQRKSLAERDWKLRLGSCSSRMCCEKKCLKDA